MNLSVPAVLQARRRWSLATAAIAVLLLAAPAQAQVPLSDPITLQGLLRDAGQPASGAFDFSVRFYNGPNLAIAVATGPALAFNDVPVDSGLFALSVDPPDTEFVGEKRWVLISVRPGAATGAYTDLLPLIALTPAPQSLYALQSQTLLGFIPGDFALAGHAHPQLQAGSGLAGGNYDGTLTRTFSVDYGVGANQSVRGNQTLSVTAGIGLTGGTSNNALGDGASLQLDVGAGAGLTAAADSLSVNVGGGLAIQSGAVAINTGAGLAIEAGALAVGEGSGIQVNANNVAVRTDGSSIGIDQSNRLTVLPGARNPLWRNVVTVAISGGHYLSPQAALAALASWCTNPSAEEPCLIRIMPGEYPVSSPITLRSHVELRGSGRESTLLVRSGAGSNSPLFSAGSTCTLSAPCVVTDLGLRLRGVGTTALGINSAQGHLDLQRVTVDVAGGTGNNYAIVVSQASIQLLDSELLADGKNSRALDLISSSARLVDVALKALGEGTHALRSANGTVDSEDLRIEVAEIASGSYTAVELSGTASWRDHGSRVLGSGACNTCALLALFNTSSADLYGSEFRFQLSNDPGSNNVAIVSSSALPASGLQHSLSLRNGRMRCAGINCDGLLLLSGSFEVSGSEVFGVSDSIRTVTPGGGALTFGRVVNSVVYGGADSLANIASGTTLYLLLSNVLGGSVIGSGTRICAATVSSNGTFRSNTCP